MSSLWAQKFFSTYQELARERGYNKGTRNGTVFTEPGCINTEVSAKTTLSNTLKSVMRLRHHVFFQGPGDWVVEKLWLN